jgi:hypothetical protein
MSKVLPVPLTELIAWVGFCTSRPQQGVKYQLWYLDFFGGHPIYNPWKIDKGWQSSSHLRLKSKVLPVPLNELIAWVAFCTSNPQQGVKYQLWSWYLAPCCGMEVQKPTQALKSVKGTSNTFDLKFLYLKPTAGCQISTLIFGFFRGAPYI